MTTNLHSGSLSLSPKPEITQAIDGRGTQACSFGTLSSCSFHHMGEWKWKKCRRGTFGFLPTRTVCQSRHSLSWDTNGNLALAGPILIAVETNSSISESMEKCELLLNLFSFKNFINLKYF